MGSFVYCVSLVTGHLVVVNYRGQGPIPTLLVALVLMQIKRARIDFVSFIWWSVIGLGILFV